MMYERIRNKRAASQSRGSRSGAARGRAQARAVQADVSQHIWLAMLLLGGAGLLARAALLVFGAP